VLFNVLNCAVLAFILLGVALHHRRDLHAKMMLTAFALDIALLLAVEFSNGAVAQAFRSVASDGSDGRAITLIHVAFAASGLVMWFPQLWSGRKIWKQGRMELLPGHALRAKLFLVLRLGNVVTAFMLPGS